MKALAETAKAAQAIAADYEQQRAMFDETLKELKGSGVLVSAPDGIGLTSGKHLQATGNLIGTAGNNADFGVLRKFTVAAGEAISLFAHKLGMKLFAAKGKIEIQAQSDEVNIASDKDTTITSVNGRVVIEAAEELLFKCGSSYFRMTRTGIEDATLGERVWRAVAYDRLAPNSAMTKSSLPFSTDLPDTGRHGSRFSG
jgi:type VI secretion system secreted protein VgrG